jgi:protocatechuate 3,4-dioxygenase beta subunit
MKRISLRYIISILLLSMVGFGSLYSQTLPSIILSARPVDENKILLEWEKSADYQVNRFEIYRSVHDTVSFVYLAFVTGDKNTYLDNNLQIGVNYTYFVVALRSGPDSSSYGSQRVTTQAISGTGKVQINGAPRTYAEVNKVYSEQVRALSSDQNAILRYSLISAPSEMTIDTITGLVTWTPDRNGRFDIKINVKNINDINHIELGSPIPQTTYRFTLQVASRTSSLYGSVKSITNSPVSGLTVKIFQVNNDEFTYETLTNNEGNFYFNGISAGNYYIYVKGLFGFESKWYPDAKDFSNANIVTCVEEGITQDINFVLNQEITEQYRISGTVKDTNGIPINNATLLFYDASRFISIGLENANIEDIIDQKNVNYANSSQTNSRGEYSANLPKGKYYFAICQADGFNYMFYSNQTSLLYANKIYLNNNRSGVDFVMIPSKKTSNQLKGKVLSEDTNEGVESRIILVKKQNDERGGSGLKVPFRGVPSEIYITFKTDVLGNFEIENIDTTKYWVQAIPLKAYLPAYYHPDNKTTFNWYDADSIYTFGAISNIEIYSAPIINDGVGIITGKVTTNVKEETLQGIIVYAELDGNIVAYAVTDSLGNYLIKGLRSGEYKLSADFLGYTTQEKISVTLNYSNSFVVRNADITLQASSSIPVNIPSPFVPIEYSISQNYPNPFNPSPTIEYKLERESFVELKIYDILGREVEKLVSSTQNAGTHIVRFNAKNLASGVYFASIKVQNGNKVVYLKQIKMLLTK